MAFEYPDIELAIRFYRALRQEGGYDLLVSFAAPHPVHWGVAYARTRQHQIAKTWVADCGDPYMGNESDTFKRWFYFEYVERWFCNKVDFISVPTQASVLAYYPEFKTKIVIIPQGFKFEEIAKFRRESACDIVTFAYAGVLIPKWRDPTQFLEFIIQLPNQFRFRLYTNTQELVKPFVNASNGRIEIFPIVPRATLLEELGGIDFVVNFENAGNRQTPSKLIDYAILEKPILSIGKSLPRETILEFLDRNYSHRFEVQDIDRYRIETVSSHFLALALCSHE